MGPQTWDVKPHMSEDADLVRRALARVQTRTDEGAGEALGVSHQTVRTWRRGVSDDVVLRSPSREALRRFLATGSAGAAGPALGSPDYWRGVVATAERMARALADTLAAELSRDVSSASDADPGAPAAGAAQAAQAAAQAAQAAADRAAERGAPRRVLRPASRGGES